MNSSKIEPKENSLTYLGIKNPANPLEIEFEISGLETLIAEANYRISQLKQGQILAKCLSENRDDNSSSQKW